MINQAKRTFDKLSTQFQVKKPWDILIILVLNVLIAIPIFIIVHQNLLDFNWYFEIDRIILFVLIISMTISREFK